MVTRYDFRCATIVQEVHISCLFNIPHLSLVATTLQVHEHMMESTFFHEEYDEGGRVIDTGEPDIELDVPRQ